MESAVRWTSGRTIDMIGWSPSKKIGGVAPLAFSMIAVLAQMQVPLGRNVLQHASGETMVSEDFDLDGRKDVAGLFRWQDGSVIELWIQLGTGDGFRLESVQDTVVSRAYRLKVVFPDQEGDPTCPRIVNGRRACSRADPIMHFPAITLTGANVTAVWRWNGYAFERSEVFE